MQVNPLEIRVEKSDSVDAVVELLRGYLGVAHGAGAVIVVQLRCTIEGVESVEQSPESHDAHQRKLYEKFVPKNSRLVEMGELITEVMSASRLRVQDVAKALSVSPSAVSSFRVGRYLPSDEVLAILHVALGLPKNDPRILRVKDIARECRGKK